MRSVDVPVALLPRLLPRQALQATAEVTAVPRAPRGKRIAAANGSIVVVSKNPNGAGSVYYDTPAQRANGRAIPGRWRATYIDLDGHRRRVTDGRPTRR